MSEAAIREAINSGWFVISISLVWLFLHYLASQISEAGWYARNSSKAALALLSLFVGMAILFNPSYRVHALSNEAPLWLVILGAVFGYAGGLCTFRVFSPIAWGHGGWITVGVVAVAYAAAVLFLT